MSMTISNQEDFSRVQHLVWDICSASLSRRAARPGDGRSKRRPVWPGWSRLNGRLPRPATYRRPRRSCVRWPKRSSSARCSWQPRSRSAGLPGRHRPACRRPGPSGALAAGCSASPHLFVSRGKEVRPIKTKEGTGMKRLNINISKSFTAASSPQEAADAGPGNDRLCLSFIQKYVDERTRSCQEEQARLKRAGSACGFHRRSAPGDTASGLRGIRCSAWL